MGADSGRHRVETRVSLQSWALWLCVVMRPNIKQVFVGRQRASEERLAANIADGCSVTCACWCKESYPDRPQSRGRRKRGWSVLMVVLLAGPLGPTRQRPQRAAHQRESLTEVKLPKRTREMIQRNQVHYRHGDRVLSNGRVQPAHQAARQVWHTFTALTSMGSHGGGDGGWRTWLEFHPPPHPPPPPWLAGILSSDGVRGRQRGRRGGRENAC